MNAYTSKPLFLDHLGGADSIKKSHRVRVQRPQFVLDCCSVLTPKITLYNGLTDKFLGHFFTKKGFRHHLKKMKLLTKRNEIVFEKECVSLDKTRKMLTPARIEKPLFIFKKSVPVLSNLNNSKSSRNNISSYGQRSKKAPAPTHPPPDPFIRKGAAK